MGTLTIALAAITTQVDSLTNNRAPQAATLREQPSTSSVENTTATFSAVPGPCLEEQVLIQAQQWMKSSHPTFVVINDDEMDGEEGEQLPATRNGSIISGELRSTDTTAIEKVLWPHELVFTHEGQTAAYESLSAMSFINGYLCTMSFEKDSLRDKMAVHLHEMMKNGETFGWPMVRAYHAVWLQHLAHGS